MCILSGQTISMAGGGDGWILNAIRGSVLDIVGNSELAENHDALNDKSLTYSTSAGAASTLKVGLHPTFPYVSSIHLLHPVQRLLLPKAVICMLLMWMAEVPSDLTLLVFCFCETNI